MTSMSFKLRKKKYSRPDVDPWLVQYCQQWCLYLMDEPNATFPQLTKIINRAFNQFNMTQKCAYPHGIIHI